MFIHDIPAFMMESQKFSLPHYINIYNQADAVIVPTTNALNILQEAGLKVKKIVIQDFWDHPMKIDTGYKPVFNKTINFAGNPKKFGFVKKWNSSRVELAVTSNKEEWMLGKNIKALGWYHLDEELATALRHNGGFGLHWATDDYWSKYMTMNTSYKLSLYLAAGLPVVIPSYISQKDKIIEKNLGIVADSLDDAIEQICSMDESTYYGMVDSIDEFAKLIREGFFTKKAVAEAIFKLFYE